ncbi:hypothetical protein MMC10_005828 [Thelotrema lepadinum]|nr:hypothetical protein [Thelotrema lepadinum]
MWSLVFRLKYKLQDCDMNTGADNEWTFGQYLALLMLVAPAFSAWNSLLDKTEENDKNSGEEDEASDIRLEDLETN